MRRRAKGRLAEPADQGEFAKEMARVDAERLRISGPLEEGERAVEHLSGWALCGWPTLPLERAQREDMFLPADALDNYLEGLRASLFGIRPLLVIALLTDRRLVIRPLDAFRAAPHGQRYATYHQRSLARRFIWLGAIEGITLLPAAQGLPDGQPAAVHLRVITRAIQGSGSVVEGPPMPTFDISHLHDVHDLFGPEPGLVLTIAESAFLALPDLILGAKHVGIQMMESSLTWAPSVEMQESLVDFQEDRITPWRPLYERYR